MTSAPRKPDGVPPVGIETLEVFSGLAPETLETLKQQAQRRKLSKGELIFSPGDPAEAAYAIVSGRIRIWTVSAAGAEVTLNVLSAGALLGEIGLLDGSQRTAGASAMRQSELLIINRRAFFAALDRDPRMARNIIGVLCDRLRWVSARMEDSALRSAPDRLARMLQHLSMDHGRETEDGIALTIDLTQGELARWTMMSRESLNKILNRWSDDGLVAQVAGRIVLKDVERLEEIAEFGEDGG